MMRRSIRRSVIATTWILVSLIAPGPRAEAPALHPFPIDWTQAQESVVDLSSLLDAPAGKTGFIRLEKDHLVRPDGARFRVWGLNLCGPDCFPAKEDVLLIAAEGRPLGPPLRAARAGGQWRIPLGDPVTTWYVLEVKR